MAKILLSKCCNAPIVEVREGAFCVNCAENCRTYPAYSFRRKFFIPAIIALSLFVLLIGMLAGFGIGAGLKYGYLQKLSDKEMRIEWQQRKNEKYFCIGPFCFKKAERNPYLYEISLAPVEPEIAGASDQGNRKVWQ